MIYQRKSNKNYVGRLFPIEEAAAFASSETT